MSRRLVALTAAALLIFAATACEPTPPDTQAYGPNTGQPVGWTCVSTQSWWQAGDTVTAVPQKLPASGVGGHLHVEVCFPVNQRVDGDRLELVVHVKTHQRFTGRGTRIDVGLAPGGSTIAAVPLSWDSRCPSGMCHTSAKVTVPLGSVGDGLQILRLRYLSVAHPNGERQFASNELPFWHNQTPAGCPKATEGKGWYDARKSGGSEVEYARAGVNGCLPSGPVSGVYTLRQRYTSTREDISAVQTYMDARFGSDQFATLIDSYRPKPGEGVSGSGSRTVAIDTTRFPDGWHCLSVLTSVPDLDAVNTGVQEFPILIDNPGGPTDASVVEHRGGACWVNAPMPM